MLSQCLLSSCRTTSIGVYISNIHITSYHYSITIVSQYANTSRGLGPRKLSVELKVARNGRGKSATEQWLRSTSVGWWLVGWCWVLIMIQYSGDHNPLWEYIFTRVMYNWDGVRTSPNCNFKREHEDHKIFGRPIFRQLHLVCSESMANGVQNPTIMIQ